MWKNKFSNYFVEFQEKYTNTIKKLKTFYFNHLYLLPNNKIDLVNNGNKQRTTVMSIDYALHNAEWTKLWNDILADFLVNEAFLNIKYTEIAHTLRFVYTIMPPNDKLGAHTDFRQRKFCSINFPLTNNCIIDFYKPKNNNLQFFDESNFELLYSHHYKNPIILNPNNFHGVNNNSTDERMVFKISFPTIPWNMLIDSYKNTEGLKLYNFEMPWDVQSVQNQNINNLQHEQQFKIWNYEGSKS